MIFEIKEKVKNPKRPLPPKPKLGDERIITKFAFPFPKKVGYGGKMYYVWLESYEVVEVYKKYMERCGGDPLYKDTPFENIHTYLQETVGWKFKRNRMK